MESGRAFSRLMEEYGSVEKPHEAHAAVDAIKQKVEDANVPTESASPERPIKQETRALMQEEERYTGAVSWSVYTRYFNYAGGFLVFPLILLWISLVQGAQGACDFTGKRAAHDTQ